ncbi:MAG: hypothetical protein A3B91_01260 [Candidatus Yanofskybacteria bacterium RIFCSPHIGHO2_02_FULL_41_29]|uniref:Methyltransferase type 11 domain-containing protein n=1 Tax=Candidatus Yanofskybacteria bacterium RIFCSPHIGHO2_01_FULL_41_53 TaxID=1802663 RepID=A0A1F8ELL1_9BACT|nr:MAG: hypothetical protein A2650_02070 [Candidatus Yanofskybacteria bacterium RIFCSPHIGHO2_01_FULL_41_53]OGN10248.1 MAG: hypothetical protein A3B91_01260 [Candidatus Yanofskybacteria bacterium RIFCSPHIGHO2_02_FULL_41_29]OGN22689.1 MAG: hypothetical protein A2916_02205 [Candidatus Yanofskybacteria bacterium RIFCSPLOWO2_01_FULL_41_67]OGN30448.1 MAG: hypothetical protein A3H54_00255 [Candidatus Yanofskybacteria bacterium RIFCSPLOWO2_02_FULL_41_13]
MQLKNLMKAFSQFPYTTLSGKFLIWDYFLLRMFSKSSFSAMSIIPFVKKAYNLDSDEELRARYYFSRIGAEELWNSRSRNDQASIEHFYQEHDMDIWRQAYYSKYDYGCKKKMVQTYHILKSSVKKNEPILDFGCGSGVFFHYLFSKGFKAVDAADIPSCALDFISKWMFPYACKIINLGKEQLPKNHYAGVVAIDCLEHTTEPLKIAQGLIESMREGGILIIKFPKESDFSWTHIRQAQEQRDATFDFIKKSCKTVVPEHVYRKI